MMHKFVQLKIKLEMKRFNKKYLIFYKKNNIDISILDNLIKYYLIVK